MSVQNITKIPMNNDLYYYVEDVKTSKSSLFLWLCQNIKNDN